MATVIDRAMEELTLAGFTSGSVADREYARLTGTGSILDKYSQAKELPRIAGRLRSQQDNGNPDFEVDTNNWTMLGSGATKARSTDQAFSGAASMLVTPNGTAIATTGWVNVNCPVIFPGLFYQLTVWIYSPNGYDSLFLRARWNDADQNTISTIVGDNVVIPAAQWIRLTGVFEAPPLAHFLGLHIRMSDVAAITDTFYVDESYVHS